MPAISVGSVYVDLLPQVSKFLAQMGVEADRASKQVGKQMADNLDNAIAKGVSDGVSDGADRATPKAATSGDRVGGAFGTAARKRIEAALKALPDVKLDADSSAVDRELVGIRARMEGLRAAIGVSVDDGAALREMDYLRLRLDQLRMMHPSISIDVDAGAAIAELLAVRTLVASVGGGAGGFPGMPGLGGGGGSGLGALAGAGESGGEGAGAGAGSVLGPIAMVGAIATAVPSIVGIAAVATEAVGGLAAGLAAAVGGAGAFAAIAIPAWREVTKAEKELATAQQAYANATTAAARKSALAKEEEARKILAAFKPVTDGINALVTAFDKLTKPFEAPVFKVIGDTLKGVAAAVPVLTPLFAAAAGAVSQFAQVLLIALHSPAFSSFINFLAQQAGPALQTFARVLVAVTTGISGILEAFGPALPTIEAAVTNIAFAFANWGQSLKNSPGIQQFFAYVAQVAPSLKQFLKDFGGLLWDLLTSVAPLAQPAIDTLDGLVNVLRDMWDFLKVVLLPEWHLWLDAMGGASGHTQDYANMINTIMIPGFKALRAVVLDVVIPAFQAMLLGASIAFGGIVNGAAAAFGWIPGLGGRLRDAAKAFNDFEANANAALDGIRKALNIGVNIDVSVHEALTTAARTGTKIAIASGGLVTGPGTGTSDSIDARLSNGEYVVRAAAVNSFGVANLDAINRTGFAGGGLVGGSRGGIGDVALSVYRLPGETDDAAATVRALRGLAYELASA